MNNFFPFHIIFFCFVISVWFSAENRSAFISDAKFSGKRTFSNESSRIMIYYVFILYLQMHITNNKKKKKGDKKDYYHRWRSHCSSFFLLLNSKKCSKTTEKFYFSCLFSRLLHCLSVLLKLFVYERSPFIGYFHWKMMNKKSEKLEIVVQNTEKGPTNILIMNT